MSRIYIRFDPQFYDRLVVEKGFPDGAVVAFIGAVCGAEQQDWRGRFRNKEVLKAHLLRRHHRFIAFLLEHHQLLANEIGLEIDGWDPWQEGNLTPQQRERAIKEHRGEPANLSSSAIRMRRLRNRDGEASQGASPVGTGDKAPPASPTRARVNVRTVERKGLAVSVSGGDALCDATGTGAEAPKTDGREAVQIGTTELPQFSRPSGWTADGMAPLESALSAVMGAHRTPKCQACKSAEVVENTDRGVFCAGCQPKELHA